MADLHLVTLVVRDYDQAIRFFIDILGCELVEDVPALTNDGRAKRWVIVRPAGGETGILLARANDDQAGIIGQQFAGRVGFFLRVDDFEASYNRMSEAEGNRWDLLGPDPSLRTGEDSRRDTPG